MAKLNYYVLPGVEYVNGAAVPVDRIVSLEPAEAAFDLLEGRIVLGNVQPPGITIPPALLATDVLAFRRGDNPSSATVEQLGAFVAGSVRNWKPVSANYQAAVGDWLQCDTVAASFTVTLPSGPTEGASIWIADATGSFATHPLTIARNGKSFKGVSEDLVADVANAELHLVFRAGTWRF